LLLKSKFTTAEMWGDFDCCLH